MHRTEDMLFGVAIAAIGVAVALLAGTVLLAVIYGAVTGTLSVCVR